MLRYLSLLLLSAPLLTAQFIEIDEGDYTGSDDLLLFPGTSISGGITPSTDDDLYSFELPSTQLISSELSESITFKLNYTHSFGPLSPKSHLRAFVFSSIEKEGAASYVVFRGELTTRNLFGGFPNTLSLTLPTSTLLVDETNPGSFATYHYVQVKSDSGSNPSYTLSLNANAPKDHFDSAASNDTQATASQLTAKDPSQIIFREDVVNFHSNDDVDWYQFTPGVSGNYHARIGMEVARGPSTPLDLEVSNGLGQILSSPSPSANPRISFSVFTATAGETYFIKASPGGPGVSYYGLHLSLITPEEHVPPLTERFSAPAIRLDLSTIASGPLSFGPFSMDSVLTNYSSSPEHDPILFTNVPEGRYLATIESENLIPPTVLDSSFINLSTVENRSFFFVNWDEDLFRELYALNDDQLGFYSLSVRPLNDFDLWWGRPIERDVEINGLPAEVIYALNLDRTDHHGDLFQIASNASLISLNLPLSAEGTNAPVVFQESTDLITWSDIPSENLNQPSATIPADTFGNVSITYPAGEPRRFVRVALPE